MVHEISPWEILEVLICVSLAMSLGVVFGLAVAGCDIGHCDGMVEERWVGMVELLVVSILETFVGFRRNLVGQVCGGPQKQRVWTASLLLVNEFHNRSDNNGKILVHRSRGIIVP